MFKFYFSRISDIYVEETFKLLMHQLTESHSEIRLSSFNIVKELFKRSHHFRELLSDDFSVFSKLVLDIDPQKPLPPPAAAAKHLRFSASKTIKEWNEVYGVAYKKLRIGYNYLKRSGIVDFDDLEARTTQQRSRIEERETRLNSFKHIQLQALMEEFATEELDINTCVTQMQNGLSLLVPDDCEESGVLDDSPDLRAHGMTDPNFSIIVEVKPIQVAVNRDNKEVIQFLRDQCKLLSSRFLPSVLKWNIVGAKLGAEEQFQKKILDLKMKLESILHKYQELNLPQSRQSDDGSDESDLETVPDEEVDEDETLISFIQPRLSYIDEYLIHDNEPGPSGSSKLVVKRKPNKSSPNKLPLDIESYQLSQSQLPGQKLNLST